MRCRKEQLLATKEKRTRERDIRIENDKKSGVCQDIELLASRGVFRGRYKLGICGEKPMSRNLSRCPCNEHVQIPE